MAINIPRKSQGPAASSILSLAGAGAGAMLGGPAGAGMGMQLGGMAGGMSDANRPQGPQAVETGAIGRRMQQLDQSPLRQIRQSIDSLKYIDDDATRMELAKPLVMAEMAAKKGGSYGG